jgi:hypothetical protein
VAELLLSFLTSHSGGLAFRSGELTAIGLIYSRSRDLTAPYRLTVHVT